MVISLYNGSHKKFKPSRPLLNVNTGTYAMPQDFVEVDAKGMNCPMPLLKAKQALNKAAIGEQVKVLATDAGSQRDFQVFCQQSGHSLEHSTEEGGVFTYIICKK